MLARDDLDDLGAKVAKRWGETSRWDLEMRTGLLPEVGAARRALGERWPAVVAEFLAGPKPRMVAAALLKVARKHQREPVRVELVREVVNGLPTIRPTAPGLSGYQRALLGLADDAPKVQ